MFKIFNLFIIILSLFVFPYNISKITICLVISLYFSFSLFSNKRFKIIDFGKGASRIGRGL